jgi:hypothetical protein
VSRFPRETSDAGLAPLAAMAVLALIVAVCAGALRPVQALLARGVGRADAGLREVSAAAPPAPRLQAHPEEDLARLRAAEDDRLDGWGWADRKAGLARVPIARAMDALARGEARP